MNLKLATINTGRLCSPQKRKQLSDFCFAQEFDIVGLQEVAFSSCDFLEVNFSLLCNPGPKSCGTALLIKKNLNWSNPLFDPDGRLLRVCVCDVTFVVVYAPSGQPGRVGRRKMFCETLPAYVSDIEGGLILLGDFNSVESSLERQENSSTPTDWALKEMKKGLELTDLWTKLRGGEDGHTFHHARGSSRIDRFFVNKIMERMGQSIETVPTSFTDHFALVCVFLLDGKERSNSRRARPIRWKLNSSFLSEEEFVALIEKFVDNAVKLPLHSSDVRRWWEEIFKPGVKKISMDYGRKRAALIRDTRSFYQSCLLDLSSCLQKDASFWEEFSALKQQAKRWEESTLEGIGIRSRVQDGIDHEQISVFHSGRLNNNKKECTITCLTEEDGTVITEPDAVDSKIVSFFDFILATTHSGEKKRGEPFLHALPSHDLSSFRLEDPLNLMEISSALDVMDNNKSPGCDGIPYEFYKTFWKKIGPLVTAVFNKVLEEGVLCDSQGEADLRLVPKCAEPKRLNDYRPISLLNADYKLLSATLANRLKSTLPIVISPAQKGGVPGRKIVSNLVLYRDVIQHMEDRSRETRERADGSGWKKTSKAAGAIISVDLEKAFDRVDRDLLWLIMETMGFPPGFIRSLKTLYSIAKVNVLNGNRSAGRIHHTVSLRQGCPLSMHFFVIFIEPLIVLLSARLTGIFIPKVPVKLRALVDDLAVFVSTEEDVIITGDTLDDFCDWSGAKVQKKKTKALGLGAWQERSSWPVPWLESSKEEKLLGISFSASIEETAQRSWKQIEGHLLGLLRANISRRLTLHQRAKFSKDCGLSRAIYVARILPCPEATAKKIESSIGTFIWCGKMERPQFGCLLRKMGEGGLGLVQCEPFFRSLLLKPIGESLFHPQEPESSLACYWLGFPLRHLLPVYEKNSQPYAVINRPPFLDRPLKDIRSLLEGKVFSSVFCHKKAYQHWIKASYVKGKVELDHPSIHWTHLWKNLVHLPAPLFETMFLFNHRLLHTKIRAARFDKRNSPICDFCEEGEETDLHAMMECSKRMSLFSWLESQLRSMGCTTEPSVFIRGDVGKMEKRKDAVSLVAAYVHASWRERGKGQLPTVRDISKEWTKTKRFFGLPV